ncbi:hypothetical protein T08_8673 [Trichinella sp. T8]|nr:hypothetical protein T08_8673 [Trichinella sp. T8]
MTAINDVNLKRQFFATLSISIDVGYSKEKKKHCLCQTLGKLTVRCELVSNYVIPMIELFEKKHTFY